MKTQYGFDAPIDYQKPNWQMCSRVHDWKNYISEQMVEIWDTFSDYQKSIIAINADKIAQLEEWD